MGATKPPYPMEFREQLVALVIAEAMKFRPALMDSEPVGVWILQMVAFNTI